MFNFLLPSVCALCQQPKNCHYLCKKCTETLPRPLYFCRLCFHQSKHPLDICGACLKKSPPWQTIFIPFIYDDTIKFLIRSLKFNRQTYLAKTFAHLFIDFMANSSETKTDIIIPVPLHKKRLASRQFNQSHLIAKHIGSLLKIPVFINIAYRSKNTKSQSVLGQKARLLNMKNAFMIKNGATITNKHIAVVDDAYTTGATLRALCVMLKKYQPKSIEIWCVARSKNQL